MMTKTVHSKIWVRCDVAHCDSGDGPITARMVGGDPGLMLAELEVAGWALGKLDACPSCVKKLEENRARPLEDPDGA